MPALNRNAPTPSTTGSIAQIEMSRWPDQASESRQHPAEGRLMIDGPGPPSTSRRTAAPTRRRPRIRCARMTRLLMGSTCTRETQRILLPRVRAGGETSGFPKISAAIRRSCPTACGMRGRGDEKPVRAQRGNTPRFRAGAHFAGRASRAAASPGPGRSRPDQEPGHAGDTAHAHDRHDRSRARRAQPVLGMSWSPFGVFRTPVALAVRARLRRG